MSMARTVAAALAALALLSVLAVVGGSPVGCGGFVLASPELARLRRPEHGKLDYSQAQVELRTAEGQVKDTAPCFKNGYYFVPAYDRGNFVVRVTGPSGWSFEPKEVEVVVDSQGCRALDAAPPSVAEEGHLDINFALTGFGVVGVVGAAGAVAGPAGVTVALAPLDAASGAQVVTAPTTEGGAFVFPNVPTGRYRVEASHKKWLLEGAPAEVEVSWGSVEAPVSYKVRGFDVSGGVESQGSPVFGVQFFVFADDPSASVSCSGVGGGAGGGADGPAERRGRGPACWASSQEDGSFEFDALPPGRYTLVPRYKGESTVFDVSPKELAFTVGLGSLRLPTVFKVTGFSIGGRVVDSLGKGVPGAAVLINGAAKTTTDTEGRYKLDEVKTGEYTITATKEEVTFGTLQDFKVLPSLKTLPDVVASGYAVCGRLLVLDSRFGGSGRRQVALTDGPPGTKPLTGLADESGNFCFQGVPDGKYVLSPMVSGAEAAAGLLFSPATRDVSVHGAPLHGADFTQASLSLSGSVACIGAGGCGPLVRVSLVPEGGKAKAVVAAVSSGGEFVFEDVLPGRYRVEVKKQCAAETKATAAASGIQCPRGGSCWMDEDEWCWAQQSLEVEMKAEDVKGLSFQQTGWRLRVDASHDIKAVRLFYPEGVATEPTALDVKTGWNEFCVPHPGTYQLQHLSQPIFYGSLAFSWTAGTSLPLQWHAQHYLLRGSILIDSKDFQQANEITDRIALHITSGNGTALTTWNSPNYPDIAELASEEQPVLRLTYSWWAPFGETLVFKPRHDGGLNVDENVAAVPKLPASEVVKEDGTVMDPEEYIFYGEADAFPPRTRVLFCPSTLKVTISSKEPQAELPSFVGKPGKQIIGRINPPIEGVHITAVYKTKSVCMSAAAGSLAQSTLSQADGQFALSPLAFDAEFVVSASKPGFLFGEPSADFVFEAQQLAHILVKITPKDAAEADLSAIVLTLTGDNGFRKNAVVGPNGSINFQDLHPGSYFLRPLLKEYQFEPAHLEVDVGSGETAEAGFTAKRVAFSVIGVVTYLGGHPAVGVLVEAVSEDHNHKETALTDASGMYRLRALMPEARGYEVGVALERPNREDVLERASPKSMMVQVADADLTGIDFVVFEKPPGVTVSGVVVGPDVATWQPHIRVELISGATGLVEQSAPLPVSYFFEVSAQQPGQYSVALRFTHPDPKFVFHTTPVSASLEGASTFVGQLAFKVDVKERTQAPSPLPVLPLVLAIGVIIITTSFSRFDGLVSWAISAAGGLSSSSTDKASANRIRKSDSQRKVSSAAVKARTAY